MDVHLTILERLDAAGRRGTPRRGEVFGRPIGRRRGAIVRRMAVRVQEGLRRLAGAAAIAPARTAGALIGGSRRVVFASGMSVRRAIDEVAATARAASVAIIRAQRSGRSAVSDVTAHVHTQLSAARTMAVEGTRSVGRGTVVTMSRAARQARAAARGVSATLRSAVPLLARPPRAFGRAARRAAATVRDAGASLNGVERALWTAVAAHVGRVASRVSTSRRAFGRGMRGVVRDVQTGFTDAARSVRSATLALGSRALSATRTVGSHGLGPSTFAIVAGIVIVALAVTLRPSEHLSTGPAPTGDVAASAIGSGARAALPGTLDGLHDPSLSEETKLAIVEGIARDSSDAATDALISAAKNASVLVSMASIRALRGRPCNRMGAPLARHLAHRDWQRRAWAAKVLGENGCAAAAPALKRRLMRERDVRVQKQLAAALATLIARAG